MTNDVLDRTESDFNGLSVQLIRKYAVLLSILLVIEFLLSLSSPFLMDYVLAVFPWDTMRTASYTLVYTVPRYLSNIVVALVMYNDMRKTNTVLGSVIVLTLLYNEIGVCLFILRLLYIELMTYIESRR